MSKYIDLMYRIDRDKGLNGPEYSVVWLTLDWLDNHPDQVPGQTITEVRQGDVDRVTRNSSDNYTRGVYAGLLIAKAKIVPDPEPTNAEKWDALVGEWHETQDANPAGVTFGEWLDAAGVKAPEVDK